MSAAHVTAAAVPTHGWGGKREDIKTKHDQKKKREQRDKEKKIACREENCLL